MSLSGLLLAGAALAVGFPQAAGAAAIPAYAPSKTRLCPECPLPVLPADLPRRGAVLDYGAFFNNRSTWYLLDLDAARASRIEAHADRAAAQFTLVIDKRIDRALMPTEMAELTTLLNRIWISPLEPLREPLYHNVWDLWLFDGDERRHDGGPARPNAATRELETMTMRLVGPQVPVVSATR